MVTTEKEYLDILRDRLTGYVTGEDLDEVMEEYAGHFAIGKSRGRTEEELCTALGSPEDVAKEIRAAFLIHKAEQTKSAGTIWQATRATTRLHGLSFAAVIVPFILFAVVFSLVFIAGLAMICGGAVLLLLAVAKLLGLALSLPWHPWRLSPEPGVLVSMGIFIARDHCHYRRYVAWAFLRPRGCPAPQGKTPAKKRCRVLFALRGCTRYQWPSAGTAQRHLTSRYAWVPASSPSGAGPTARSS